MGLKNLIRKYGVPCYAIGPLIFVLAYNMMVYTGTRLINEGRKHYTFSFPIDNWLPLVTPFVVIYLLAFVQWVAGYWLAARESRRVCYQVILGDFLAKTITLVFFLLLPTTMSRPEITGTGFFNWLTKLVYRIDPADNLFPSIHCLESWVCFRSSFWLKKVPGWYRPVSFVFTLLVCASTVLLKQHLVIDIPAGILAAEVGLLISKRFFRNRPDPVR